jgi:hypothetical protein
MASVDVIIPNYQYGRFLRDCVGSVLRQGIRDLLPEIGNTTDLNMLMRLASHGRVAESASSLAIQRLHGANLTASHWASRQLSENYTTSRDVTRGPRLTPA